MPGFNINNAANAGGRRLPSATVETFRAQRWRVEFMDVRQLDDIILYAQSCQRPGVEIDTIIIHNRQNMIRLPGKYKWNPISIKFYETILKSAGTTTLSALFDYWSNGRRAVVNYNTNTINQDFRSNIKIYLDDGEGQEQHIYTLYNAWPSKVEPSELTYTSSDISTVNVIFNYDSASEGTGAANPFE